MKYAIDGQRRPRCGAVLKVLQSPWPHTGEVNAVYKAICNYASAETTERIGE